MTVLTDAAIEMYKDLQEQRRLANLQHDRERHERQVARLRKLLKLMLPDADETLEQFTFTSNERMVEAEGCGLRFRYQERHSDLMEEGVMLVVECPTCHREAELYVSSFGDVGRVLSEVRDETLCHDCGWVELETAQPEEPPVPICPLSIASDMQIPCLGKRCAMWVDFQEECALALQGQEIARKWERADRRGIREDRSLREYCED